MALVNEARQNNGQPTVGFVNPLLYGLGVNPKNYQNLFHDITDGNNGHPAVQGYDLVTGWGTPKPNFFVIGPRPQPPVILSPKAEDYAWFKPIMFYGTGQPGASINVTLDDKSFCQAQVGSDGWWSCPTPRPPLSISSHTLSATQGMSPIIQSPPAQVKFAIKPGP
ncbi:hypothetical protein [Phyllobacterium salinisoli]|uniref:hypothetical protein n=1 Tax=Phyllobacterium salinisoli TaxID=1899321 RepID=UPI0011C056A7|nr:hypothetical protein [Phyllobacterium salinisoli]